MLGVLLRVSGDTFKKIDFRVLTSVSQWVQDQLTPDAQKSKKKGKKKAKK